MYAIENAQRRDFESRHFELVNIIVDCEAAASAVLDRRRRQQAAHVRLARPGYSAPACERQPATDRRRLGTQLVWFSGWLVGGPRAADRTEASSATQSAGAL